VMFLVSDDFCTEQHLEKDPQLAQSNQNARGAWATALGAC
jgi:hypothetical protein